MKNLARLSLVTSSLLSLSVFSTSPIFAAPNLSQVAYNIEIKDSNPPNGSIVAVRKAIYMLSDRDYDPGIYAVIQEDAAITLNEVGSTTRPVVTNGQALVRVTKTNGAIKEGVPVKGYTHWSLLDNFEWDKGFWPRFGLVKVDFKTQKRTIRPSAYGYAKICKENAIEIEN